MGILKSTNSGKGRYWETILLNKGYYKNPKYPGWIIHPDDRSVDRIPDDVIVIDENSNLATVYVIIGNYGRRVQLVDMEHLRLIEEYWSYKKMWTDSIAVNHAKWLGDEIIKYADRH